MLVHALPEVACGSISTTGPMHRVRVVAASPAARVLDLQRMAGNAAVAQHLARRRTALPGGGGGALQVQRCGPAPCNCSDDERADYAARHPEEQAEAPDVGG